MPVIIPRNLPAFDVLEQEHVFVMDENRAITQDIRPLKLLILNLMPKKIETEIQLLRVLSNTPLQIHIDWLCTKSYTSKNTSEDHLANFYKTFDEIKEEKYDGMIITGAPVETLPFQAVDYWRELTEIFDFAERNVHSTFFICWAFQAALYYFYGIDKKELNQKLFGVFEQSIVHYVPLVQGFDDCFYVPQSRHSTNDPKAIKQCDDLTIVAQSSKTGVSLCIDEKRGFVFASGHSEYEQHTLGDEYKRDQTRGDDIAMPQGYFPDNDPNNKALVRWRAHATLLFSNWLNYYVYQSTPFDIDAI